MRKLLASMLLLLVAISIANAQITIPNLPAGASLNGSELFIGWQNATTVKLTAPQLAEYILGTASDVTAVFGGTCDSSTYLRGDGLCEVPPGTGGGTVNSVALSDGSNTPIFSITGSPITSSGTLIETLISQNADTVLAGPSSGSSSQPTFRTLTSADIPNNAADTTGNAATATAFATTPSQCGGIQFSTGIGANGNANCSALTSADIPNNAANTTGNAATATGFSATPTQCSGELATGVTSTGNANCTSNPSSLTVGSPTGGNLGTGSINAQEISVNDVPVATTTSGCTTGSFTATLTGYTSDPTGTVDYFVCGYQVTLYFPDTIGNSSTSNTDLLSLTGLPSAIQPTNNETATCNGLSSSNSGNFISGIAVIGPSQGAGTATFWIPIVSGSGVYYSDTSFISSGTGAKYIANVSTCTYLLY